MFRHLSKKIRNYKSEGYTSPSSPLEITPLLSHRMTKSYLWVYLSTSSDPLSVTYSLALYSDLSSFCCVDESMQKLFEGGKGSVFQRVLSWIPSHNHQLQLAGALAIANFARNGKLYFTLLVRWGPSGPLSPQSAKWDSAASTVV